MWAKHKQHSGFTIVELLIVIVVIAILAAISIVAYNGIQNRANDNAIKSDLASFAKRMEILKIDSADGSYPATLTSAMEFKFSKNSYGMDFQSRNVRYCYNPAIDSYVLQVNSKSKNYFKVQNGAISSTVDDYGWSVCNNVGLSSTNPSQDGFDNAANPKWSTWTN